MEPQIYIYQRDPEPTRMLLNAWGFKEGEHYTFLRDPEDMLSKVDPKVDQLFITGATSPHNGHHLELVNLLPKLKRRSVRLKVACYSAYHLRGDFNIIISKAAQDHGLPLRWVVMGFLSHYEQ